MGGHSAGVVLAGGYSTRFGDRDKALAEIDGTPMLAHVVTRLAEAVESVVVNCRTDQRAAFASALEPVDVEGSVQFALDETPDRGPLAGVAASFAAIDAEYATVEAEHVAVDGEYAAVVACDMPGVDPSVVSHLFDRAAGRDGAVPVLDGHRQPAQAVYRVPAMRTAARRQLAADRHSLRAALDRLDVAVVSPDDVADSALRHSLRDVNTREEINSLEGN